MEKEVEISLRDEKPLRLTPEEPDVRRERPYVLDGKEVKVWKEWATAEHIITSQKKLILFCMVLLSAMTIAWLVALFLWAWGPPSRMTADVLKWWLVANSTGIIGTAFSSVIRAIFSRKSQR